MNPKSLQNLKPNWQPGQSGNPAGRPNRARLTERYVSDIAASWEKHGAKVLEAMATKSPTQYADLCSRLIPKDVSVTLQTRLPGNLEPADWQTFMEVLGAIKQALPGDQRQPGEIGQFVLEAI